MPKTTLVTPGAITQDEDSEEEEEDSMYHKSTPNDTPQNDPLRTFLDKLQLGNYHHTIVNSGWNLDLLVNAYSDTPESTAELKTVFRNDWKMTLQESIRLITALKTEKTARGNVEGNDTRENALPEGVNH
ncbi:hypothetical protein RFI_09769 [Reticulomyxa filosa]|uniref:Uncharacterized protein n=1 Tax=Reticulomyxa filosa TaxID=46433 RepID=X6NNV4_RETFI|nr:hypothetical protein RFI_09769 [Reticulomyxa filosa]|eukprot:ETO27364.1 hypothetical protein RFI_09769 [Reticulomyxa filosa]